MKVLVPFNNRPKSEIEKLGSPIWDNIYICKVRLVDSYSNEDIRRFGVPTVGDSTLDRDMHNQHIVVGITIDNMVEYFKRGITVTLVHNKDAEVIYHIINNYLLAWKDQIDRAINLGNVPYDDLLLLDNFAAAVFPQAKMFGSPKKTASLFANLFSGNG